MLQKHPELVWTKTSNNAPWCLFWYPGTEVLAQITTRFNFAEGLVYSVLFRDSEQPHDFDYLIDAKKFAEATVKLCG
jgi:hypothetical protein